MRCSSALALKARWTKLASRGPHPPRSGYASFLRYNDDGEAVPFIFGGYVEDRSSDGSLSYRVSNELWRWQSKEDEWKLESPSEQNAKVPGPRLVAASAATNVAVIVGGWDPQTEGTGGVILDDVYSYSDDKKCWHLWPEPFPEGPLSRHVAVALNVDNTILIHTHRCDKYVWLLDASKQRYRRQATTGTGPSARGLHTACRIGDGRVFVFGGASQDQTMSNESFLLNVKTWEWTQMNLPTDEGHGVNVPCPRAGSTCVALDDDKVILFGGANGASGGLTPLNDLWVCEPGNSMWRKLETEVTPPARNAAALLPLGAGKFLLTGGWAPFVKTWDDCYLLEIEE